MNKVTKAKKIVKILLWLVRKIKTPVVTPVFPMRTLSMESIVFFVSIAVIITRIVMVIKRRLACKIITVITWTVKCVVASVVGVV